MRIFLKKKFKDRAISQNALAISLDVDQGSLSRFADGKTGIAGETVFKIMKYFDVQVLSPEEVPIMRRIGANAPEVQVDGENVVNVPVMAVAGACVGAVPPKRLREGVIYIFYDDVLGVVAKRLYYDGPGKLILVSDNKTVPLHPEGLFLSSPMIFILTYYVQNHKMTLPTPEKAQRKAPTGGSSKGQTGEGAQ